MKTIKFWRERVYKHHILQIADMIMEMLNFQYSKFDPKLMLHAKPRERIKRSTHN